MTSKQAATIRERVVQVAIKNLGYGEATANNAGKFITAIGGKQGMEWCALFAGHCYRRAFELEGEEPPGWLYRREGVAEPGALRLWTGMAKAGCSIAPGNIEAAGPGDALLWRRTGGHHIAILEFVKDGLCHTIEGNVGRFPAKVKRLIHDVTKEPHFKGFASLS